MGLFIIGKPLPFVIYIYIVGNVYLLYLTEPPQSYKGYRKDSLKIKKDCNKRFKKLWMKESGWLLNQNFVPKVGKL